MGGGIGHVYAMLFPDRLKTLVTIDVPLPTTMTTDKFVMMTVFSTLNLLRIERFVSHLDRFGGEVKETYPILKLGTNSAPPSDTV